jgi:hypothetical protein
MVIPPRAKEHRVVDPRGPGEGEDREEDLVRALQHLLHDLQLGSVHGREQDLGRDAGEVEDLRHVAVDLAPESPELQLLDLELVLTADAGVVKDEDVIEVLVRVGHREVGRAREQSGVAGARGPAVLEVAQDELLVEDLRVEIPLDLDVGAQQRREDPSIRSQVGLVLVPLDAEKSCLGGLTRLRSGGFRRRAAQRAAQVVLLEKEVDADAAPTCVEDRLGDRLGVELLNGDVEGRARAMDEVDDHAFEVVRRPELLRPDVGLDLSVRKGGHGDPMLRPGRTYVNRAVRDSGPARPGLWPRPRRCCSNGPRCAGCRRVRR